jgi:hypothetical protein
MAAQEPNPMLNRTPRWASPLRWAAAALACMAGLPGAALAAGEVQRYTGDAFDANGRLAYRETHYLDRRTAQTQRVVVYQCPDGRTFARKRVAGAGVAPDFRFQDGRDGYEEGVGGGTGRDVFWRAGQGQPMRRKPVAQVTADVYDAGFDAFVRRHWDALARGETVRARFLIPSRLDALPISLRPDPSAPRGELALRMRLDAWYGFAAPELRLRYRVQDRWLASFEGPGTIRDARGRHQPVRIEFARAPQATTPADLQAAQAKPLASSCTTAG